ncbi:MAG: hypothetical protein N2255_04845 [Kiritimatiellae bacterium]|nr:hypothetical protein [Kiritimatiellia bacterium]
MRKKNNWAPIKEALQQAAGRPHVPPSEDFWREFRARAPNHRFKTVAVGHSTWIPILRWTTVGLAASLLAVLGLFLPRLATRQTHKLSEILTVEVVASHSALFIMRDQDTKSTLVWVEGLTEKPNSGEVL